MVSLYKKTIRGKPYYYARECKRVDGKPKIVWQKYLGRAEDILAACVQRPAGIPPREPKEAIVTEFGAVVALHDLARRMRIVEHIDRHVPKSGRGPSVGTYLLVAAINRCVAPCSKAAIASWFQTTALRRLLDIESRQLTSQRFWDNMDRVSSEKIVAIERDIMGHVVSAFGIDLHRVLFDATNFFTFIDTFNVRCSIAQRGKSKEGRRSLRIVGLALLVTSDFHVPLLHKTYPGNQPDAPTFASLTDELVARYRQLVDGAEHVTMVFDKGNNSRDNLEAIEASPYHFIGSLVPTQHPGLLEIPLSRFRSLKKDGLPSVKAYRKQMKVFGVQRTVVVTYNDNLFVSQCDTLLREITKRQQLLRELQNRLRRHREGRVHGGQAPTIKGTQNKVTAWLKARHMKDLFHVEITERKKLPVLTYRFDKRAWQRLQRTLLGKTIIFTDNKDWTNAEIVRGYRSQYEVESAFRTMKDPFHIALRPQRHWTDQKIEVHVFYCVVALMLCSLLQRELYAHKIDRSIPQLLEDLASIREVGVVFSPPQGKRKATLKMTVSAMSDEQRALYDALELGRYLSS